MRNNLRKARKAAGYTQVSMADAINTSYANYGQIERGDRGGSHRIWDALEELLGIHQTILRRDFDTYDEDI